MRLLPYQGSKRNQWWARPDWKRRRGRKCTAMQEGETRKCYVIEMAGMNGCEVYAEYPEQGECKCCVSAVAMDGQSGDAVKKAGCESRMCVQCAAHRHQDGKEWHS